MCNISIVITYKEVNIVSCLFSRMFIIIILYTHLAKTISLYYLAAPKDHSGENKK